MRITDEMLYENIAEAREICLAELPDDIPEHKFSPRFERKMKRLIAQEKRSPFINTVICWAQRAAVFALVILAAAVGIATAEAHRTEQIHITTTAFPGVLEFNFTAGVPREKVRCSTAVVGFLPEDMEQTEERAGNMFEFRKFEDAEGRKIELREEYITSTASTTIRLDTEDAIIDELYIGGYWATAIQKRSGERNEIIWHRDNTVYFLSSDDFSLSVLMKVMENFEYKYHIENK